MAAQPVPPFATASVPPRVRVPDVVIGEPVNVRPVVPPDAATEVTVPDMQVPFTAKHPPYGRFTPASVEVAVVDAAVAEMNEEKVEVPRSPRMVVVAVLPTNTPLYEERAVVEAPELNCCSAVQVLALPVLRVTAPLAYVSPVEKVVVLVHVGTPPKSASTCPAVPAVVVERAPPPLP
jgi:hypothetical protein